MCRCDVSSEKLDELNSYLEYTLQVLIHYMDNEDVVTAALGLIDAIFVVGM